MAAMEDATAAFDPFVRCPLWAVLDEGAAHSLDCGHWIQQEEPEATNLILIEWLDRKARSLAG